MQRLSLLLVPATDSRTNNSREGVNALPSAVAATPGLGPHGSEKRGSCQARIAASRPALCDLRDQQRQEQRTCVSKRRTTLRRYMLDNVGKSVERLSMIAGGTGITPMYQVRP